MHPSCSNGVGVQCHFGLLHTLNGSRFKVHGSPLRLGRTRYGRAVAGPLAPFFPSIHEP